MHSISFDEDLLRWAEASQLIIAPRQKRSRETLARILSTSMRLFTQRGFERTTLSEISGHSGVAMGSIYQRFPSKEAILKVILDGYCNIRLSEISSLFLERQRNMKNAKDVISLHFEIMFSAFDRDLDVLRLVEIRRLVDQDAYDLLLKANSEIVDLVVGALSGHLPDRSRDDLRDALFYIHNMVRGSLVWCSLPQGVDHPSALSIHDPRFLRSAISLAIKQLEI